MPLYLQILGSHSNIPWRDIRTLGELQSRLNATLSDMKVKVQELLHPEPFTKSEICELLNTNIEALNETSLSDKTKHCMYQIDYTLYVSDRCGNI